jgi:hypothetical protein
MVEVDIVGIMVNQVLVNKVYFAGSMSLNLAYKQLQQKYGAKNVSIQPLVLVDDKNVYNPYNVGKHASYSTDLANAKVQFAGGA